MVKLGSLFFFECFSLRLETSCVILEESESESDIRLRGRGLSGGDRRGHRPGELVVIAVEPDHKRGRGGTHRHGRGAGSDAEAAAAKPARLVHIGGHHVNHGDADDEFGAVNDQTVVALSALPVSAVSAAHLLSIAGHRRRIHAADPTERIKLNNAINK